MKIFKLTLLGFYLNGANGSGEYGDITVKEVKERIEDQTIFDYLQARLQHDIDLSVLTDEDRQELNNEWAQLANVVDESRKLCVQNDSGLCLLVAYLFEGIQSRIGLDIDIVSKSAHS